MELFADRFLYVQPKSWMDGRQTLLWPVYVWKVLYPPDNLQLGANLFQEAILGLMRTGVRDAQQISGYLALHPELVRFIIATQLQPNGWLDAAFNLTETGEEILDKAEDSRLNLSVGYAFQDAISGTWLPRFVTNLPEIVSVSEDSNHRPQFLLDKGRGKPETPFLLPAKISPSCDVAHLTEAYRHYRRDLAAARRNDLGSDPGLLVQAIETISDQPTKMYLWCELYRDEGEAQPWLVSDPFRVGRAAAWLRKPLLESAPNNHGLIRKMQELVDLPSDNTTAEEWLKRVEEGVALQLRGQYPFLDHQDLIREHLGSVLRQRKKIEGRQNVRREELATLLGEAHNLIEAVLKWLLQTWPVDTRSWPKKKDWSREEARDVFMSLGVACVTPGLVKQLSGQPFRAIGDAIRTRDRPLKALLAGAIFCAAEHINHPFRILGTSVLDLERLPELADFRNEVSGHASGKVASLDEALDSAAFAIQWMTLFHDRY
jgi:hypothetical protein